MTSDENHLRLLTIFHYVVAGLTALIGCLPILHVGFGLFFTFAPDDWFDGKDGPPPRWFGLIFVFFGCLVIAGFWTFAACLFASARFLAQRKHYMFCLVMAAIACTCQPWGTVLGIFTIIVLMRDSVKQLFASSAAQSITGTAGGPVV